MGVVFKPTNRPTVDGNGWWAWQLNVLIGHRLPVVLAGFDVKPIAFSMIPHLRRVECHSQIHSLVNVLPVMFAECGSQTDGLDNAQ